jgi:hypothetical protein
MPHTSSSEDRYGLSSVPVLARGLLHPLSGEARASLLAVSSAFPLTSREETYHGATSFQAPLPRRLSGLSPLLHQLVCGGTCSCACAPLVRGEKPPGSSQAREHRGLRLSQPEVPYFAIADDQIHALVGDGKLGRAERIQTLRCQACRTTFSTRRGTLLYRLKTPSQQIAVVLSALVEGLDPSTAE